MQETQDEEELNIAPKKANWDLKRDVEKKLEKLNRRTQRAIVEIIRERMAEVRHVRQHWHGVCVMFGLVWVRYIAGLVWQRAAAAEPPEDNHRPAVFVCHPHPTHGRARSYCITLSVIFMLIATPRTTVIPDFYSERRPQTLAAARERRRRAAGAAAAVGRKAARVVLRTRSRLIRPACFMRSIHFGAVPWDILEASWSCSLHSHVARQQPPCHTTFFSEWCQ